jgi:hypothetical protein
MNLRDLIITEMESDTGFTVGEQSKIIKKYNSLDEDQKDAVDYIFIRLTGYDLETLISEVLDDEEELEEDED